MVLLQIPVIVVANAWVSGFSIGHIGVSSKLSGGLMPRTMCRDPICTVAEVWCCSEHYLWLFDSGFLLEAHTAMSYSVSRCVRPWIKFTLEYPFKC